ncbi:MAG: haloacid dehalogenase-like hydrolase [Desulfobacterales bacterium]|nr:haloacid dehalogenase-like hydrolase [Desulfobacterales bacterium]
MKSDQTFDRQMVVLELDGAVVHDHTPSELIRVGFPLQPERYEQAFDLFQRESTGNVKPEEALLQYATMTRGITLRRAIEYATFKMRFINGFDTFIERLYQKNVPLLLVSSSFSIITEAIRQLYGPDRFQAVLANSLTFGLEKDLEAVISEEKLIALVQRYFHRAREHQAYDKIAATGECNSINSDFLQKANFFAEQAAGLNIPFEAVNYVCSSLKDRETLLAVVRSGGRVIAFNFEESLETIIKECQKNNHAKDTIKWTTPKSRRANLRSVFETLFPDG